MVDLVQWRCITPEDDERADYRGEFAMDGTGYLSPAKARCKRDGCVDMEWDCNQDGENCQEYEHICNLDLKIQQLQALRAAATIYFDGDEQWAPAEMKPMLREDDEREMERIRSIIRLRRAGFVGL